MRRSACVSGGGSSGFLHSQGTGFSGTLKSINQSISPSDDANGSRERLRAMLVRLHARSGTGARSVIYRRRLAVPLG